ncbi:hypothetical protein FB45DRAFT_905593 [Roridomyces roridus]|uniref:Uncharacterized protein n=1 Tax=Roridomyces roridus TaxID=1738132 RepID=A0AAD7C5V4_9AGAR|nr:hypothetical protein FB45DRAFT_905593 [Roridomyces roridus]
MTTSSSFFRHLFPFRARLCLPSAFVTSNNSPSLPPELEREILEFTALCSPQCIPRLLLVARRVKTWIEPIRFRVLVFSQRRNVDPHWISMGHFVHALESKPTSFFHKHVRHITFDDGYSLAELSRVLCACSSVTNLVMNDDIGPELMPILSTLPLNRFACELEDIFFRQPIDLKNPMFSRITHVELYDFPCKVGYSGRTLPSFLS